MAAAIRSARLTAMAMELAPWEGQTAVWVDKDDQTLGKSDADPINSPTCFCKQNFEEFPDIVGLRDQPGDVVGDPDDTYFCDGTKAYSKPFWPWDVCWDYQVIRCQHGEYDCPADSNYDPLPSRGIGYAHDWLLPDGTAANGLLISLRGDSTPVFAQTTRPLDVARRESPIGFQANKLRVEDFLEHQGQTYAMVTGRILQYLTVGSFQKATIVKQAAPGLWRIDLGNSRIGMLSTWLGKAKLAFAHEFSKESPREGQEIRLLNTGGDKRLPTVRLLDEEASRIPSDPESWLTEDQLREQAPAMPCTTSTLQGRVLGTATLLRDDACEAWPQGEPPLRDLHLRSDPQRVGQRAPWPFLQILEILLWIRNDPNSSFYRRVSATVTYGDIIPDLEVVDIRGSGASTYAAVEPPRKDVTQLEGQVLEGVLLTRERSGRWFIDVGGQCWIQRWTQQGEITESEDAESEWRIDERDLCSHKETMGTRPSSTHASADGLPAVNSIIPTGSGTGQQISNVTVLKVKVNENRARMIVSPTARDETSLKEGEIMEATPVQGTPVTLASIQAQLENLRAATREHEAKANVRVVTLDTLEDIDNRIVKAVALLDSGATHAVIPFRDGLTNLEKVPVTLAGDAKQEWMRTAGGTLVAPPAPGVARKSQPCKPSYPWVP
eukprot:s2457_g1.t1